MRDGDDFVLNGQKVWTSYGDKADWMFILVRTDVEAPKHAGITFLLMDMETPGVSVRPIRLISGSSPFCETFLADVRVPVRNVVGRVNGGWIMAKALLGHERTMIADVFKEREGGKRLVSLARRYLGEEDGRVADPLARDRLTQVEMDQACLDLTLARARDNAKARHKPGPESSIFKYYGTELNQRRRELMVHVLGPQAATRHRQPCHRRVGLGAAAQIVEPVLYAEHRPGRQYAVQARQCPQCAPGRSRLEDRIDRPVERPRLAGEGGHQRRTRLGVDLGVGSKEPQHESVGAGGKARVAHLRCGV